MIPKGLKVGQTFKDGIYTYKVTQVIGENYVSERVGETSPSAPVEEPKEDIEDVKEDYESLPYAQLKKLCADRGLDASGKKAELIARLEG
jgi:hypothetical protein